MDLAPIGRRLDRGPLRRPRTPGLEIEFSGPNTGARPAPARLSRPSDFGSVVVCGRPTCRLAGDVPAIRRGLTGGFLGSSIIDLRGRHSRNSGVYRDRPRLTWRRRAAPAISPAPCPANHRRVSGESPGFRVSASWLVCIRKSPERTGPHPAPATPRSMTEENRWIRPNLSQLCSASTTLF